MTARQTPAGFYERLWRGGADRENSARWSFQEQLADRALHRLGDVRGKVVLEIGPGLGRETASLAAAGAKVVALDLTRAALERTRAASDGRAVPLLARAEQLPLGAGSVDRVFAQTVLMHLDLAAAAAEWARVLAPGGRVVVLEPIRGNPLVALYRRWFSPYRETHPSYVTVADIASACPELRLVRHEEHFLLSVAAIVLPEPLARIVRPPLQLLDRVLLALPPLRRLAWMTLAELERRG